MRTAGCLSAALMAVELLGQPASAAAGPAGEEVTSLTLVTYNLHVGVPMGQQIGAYKVGMDDLQAQADVITSTGADVVALQEVDSEYGLTLPPERHRSSLLPMPRVLSHLTGLSYVFGSAQDDIRYPSDNAGYVEWGNRDQWTNNRAPHGEVGNALLCRLPLAGPPENLPLPRLENKERRACIRAELDIPGRSGPPVILYATHLQHDSNESRVAQMQTIVERARQDIDRGALVFLMGDLNHAAENSLQEDDATSAGGAGARLDPYTVALQAGFCDLHASHCSPRNETPAPTFPADTPTQRIDYVLCSRPLRVLSADVIPTTASDHLPVRITVELP